MNWVIQAGAIRIPVNDGLVFICAWCKRCNDIQGNWQKVDLALISGAQVRLTHTICSECAKTAFGVLKRKREG